MNWPDLPRLTRTLRPLRPSQLVWRGRKALRRRLPAAFHSTDVLQGRNPLEVLSLENMPDVPAGHRTSLAGTELLVQLSRGEFTHLNETHALGRAPVDWRLGPCRTGRLWTITLNYHEWAYGLAELVAAHGPQAAHAESLLIELLTDWMTRCDLDIAGTRELAWNSYAIATRLGWWTRMLVLLGREWLVAREAFAAQLIASAARQAEHLACNLEWDLRANHLLRDAVGLAWAGRLLDLPAGERWLRLADSIAAAQADEQVLPDGGHFERSPMYHAHVLHDFRTLAALLPNDQTRAKLAATCDRMDEFTEWMRHPDGQIAQLNDAAMGALTETSPSNPVSGSPPSEGGAGGVGARHRCLTPCTLSPRAAPTAGGRHFRETGLVVWHGSPWTVFFDVGHLGPDCQPGHAHADTLTVEASLRGRRLIVDPGTHGYDLDERRRYDRSTAAHNTVCIDGGDSSEVWHIFRVGRRARPHDVSVQVTEQGFDAIASHDGYRTLPGRPRHQRRVQVKNGELLRIIDRISGGGSHAVEGGFLLAPEWSVAQTDDGWIVTGGENVVRVTLRSAAPLAVSVATRSWHPEFGREIETRRLVWRYAGTLPVEVEVTFDWTSTTKERIPAAGPGF